MLKKRSTPKEWIMLFIGIFAVMYIGYFFSLDTADHIRLATQGKFSRPFSYVYLKYFINVNSDTRVGDQTPIQYAIMNYSDLTPKKKQRLIPILDMFIEKGVDINAHSTYGLSSLHYAIMNEDPIAVELLLEKQALVNNPVIIDNLDQMVKPVRIANMTPLAFLEERKREKLIRDPEKIARIEELLKMAGGYVESPEVVAAKAKAKAAEGKKKRRK